MLSKTADSSLRLLQWHLFDTWEHIALSYVWGGRQGLQLRQDNKSALFKKGALEARWNLIPRLIQDAMELVREINRFDKEDRKGDGFLLWVDQLCIVQDDPKDKAIQIEQMHHTYGSAAATLAAIEGNHCNLPLTRCHPEASTGLISSEQLVRNVGGLRLLAGMPDVRKTVNKSVWNTRAWTLQEAEISEATIFFGKDQVRFRCAQDAFSEDIVSEIPAATLTKIEGENMEQWVNPRQASGRGLGEDWPRSFHHYARIVESYMTRKLSFPTDILVAFAGMTQVFWNFSEWKSCNGLIENVIDISLLWRPKGPLKRRFCLNGDPDLTGANEDQGLRVPTFSWAAWQGCVTYEPMYTHLHSLVKRFEVRTTKKKRKVVRFAQDGKGYNYECEEIRLDPPAPWFVFTLVRNLRHNCLKKEKAKRVYSMVSRPKGVFCVSSGNIPYPIALSHILSP